MVSTHIFRDSAMFEYHSGEEMKNNEIGWTCGMYGKRKRAYRVFV